MTIESIQKEYNELALKREQITIELYRLEGAARALKEMEVKDVLEDKEDVKEVK